MEQEENMRTIYSYSFTHRVVQLLLQRDEEEQAGAKEHFDGRVEWFRRASSWAMPMMFPNTVYGSGSQGVLYCSTEEQGFACPFYLSPTLAGNTGCISAVT